MTKLSSGNIAWSKVKLNTIWQVQKVTNGQISGVPVQRSMSTQVYMQFRSQTLNCRFIIQKLKGQLG